MALFALKCTTCTISIMKTFSTTKAREKFRYIVDYVDKGNVVAIEKYGSPKVLLIQYPKLLRKNIDDITLLAEYGGAFDWLKDEPDLYSADDLRTKY